MTAPDPMARQTTATADVDRTVLARKGRRQLQSRLLFRKRGVRLKVLLLSIAIGTMIWGVNQRATCKAQLDINERRIVSTLSRLLKFQELFKEAAVLDADGNGYGEYGWIQQIGSAAPVPGLQVGGGVWQPSVRRGRIHDFAVALQEGGGVARLYGYRFVFYFHDRPGGTRESFPLPELADDSESVRSRERRWTVYAYPNVWNETGRHTYMVGDGLVIRRTDAAHAYEGDRMPPADACPPPPPRGISVPTRSPPTGSLAPSGHDWSFVTRPQVW